MMAQVAPQVLDKIDFDQCIDELAAISGVPARILRPDSEVEKRRKETEAMMGRQAEAGQMMQMVQGMKELSGVESAEGNGVDLLMEQVKSGSLADVLGAAASQNAANGSLQKNKGTVGTAPAVGGVSAVTS